METLVKRGYHKVSPFGVPFTITSMASALLAIDIGFSGPNYTISAACATSNFCFCAAANHIRDGKADLMIAGGVESSVVPVAMGGFAACRALSRRNDDPHTACRPWDKNRDGFVMGEGAGVLVNLITNVLLLVDIHFCSRSYVPLKCGVVFCFLSAGDGEFRTCNEKGCTNTS